MRNSKRILLLALFPVFSLHAAEPLQNGDFTKGSANWAGAGRVIQVDETGQPVPSGGFPVLQIPALKTSTATCDQRLRISHDAKQLQITVVVKASPDFKINQNAPKAALNFGWVPGPAASLSPVRATDNTPGNFCLTVENQTDNCSSSYRRTLSPGGDWETITDQLALTTANQQRPILKLMLMTAPGDGSILIRSVKVEEIK